MIWAAFKSDPNDEEALRAIDLLYDTTLISSGSTMLVHGSMVPVQVEGLDEQYQQSLFRSRFLQSGRLIQDERPSSSVAASELGFKGKDTHSGLSIKW
ncbi:unnamed protein product [Camellia sinensis]